MQICLRDEPRISGTDKVLFGAPRIKDRLLEAPAVAFLGWWPVVAGTIAGIPCASKCAGIQVTLFVGYPVLISMISCIVGWISNFFVGNDCQHQFSSIVSPTLLLAMFD